MGAGHVGSEAGARGERAVQGQRRRLSLQLHRLQLLVVEDALGRPVGLLRDRDPVDRRHSLQAGGGVDHVAGDDSLALFRVGSEGDDGLAGADPDPHLQREHGVRLVELLDRLQRAEAGPDRALGIVLMRDRGAEDRHHRVPNELLDRAGIPLDLLPKACMVGADAGAHVLRICLLRGGGEADEIAEEDGDNLALLPQGESRLLAQRRAAVRAERKLAGKLLGA